MTDSRAKSLEHRAKGKGQRTKSGDQESPLSPMLYALSSKPYAISPGPPEFLAIGHFTHDIVEPAASSLEAKRALVLGGAAAYSTIAARGLGVRPAAVSAVGRDFLHYEKFHGISLALVGEANTLPTMQEDLTTTFQNVYERKPKTQDTLESGVLSPESPKPGVRRAQIIKSVSAPILAEHIPSEWLGAEIVYLCPVADEVDLSIVHMFPDSLIGVSPQGWMRQWDSSGRVSPRKWEDAPGVLPHADVLVMSEEDISPFPEVVHEYIDLVDIMVLTRGEKGSTFFQGGQSMDFPAFPTHTVDPTGAGDVFAAAFLIRFRQTHDLHEASVFANCAASFVVEKGGTEGIPDLDRVRSRMTSRLVRP